VSYKEPICDPSRSPKTGKKRKRYLETDMHLPRNAARVALALVGLTSLALIGVACGDDDDGKSNETPAASVTQSGGGDEAAVRATLDKFTKAQADGDADTFLSLVTDHLLSDDFGFATRDQIKEDPTIIQDDTPVDVKSVSVNGDKATANVELKTGFEQGVEASLIKQSGAWKIDDFQPASVKGPAGASSVDVEMVDFAFKLKPEEIKAGKPFVFHASNTGKQHHFIEMVKIPADADLQQLLQSEEQPEGVEDLGGTMVFAPGEKADVVFPDNIAPGRYVLLCFLPDTDGTPHAFKGMVADFTVQ
jgi:uncharacterized cupredoxin-like copper-binding protein